MEKTIIYFDDFLGFRTRVEFLTLDFLKRELKLRNTEILGFDSLEPAEKYVKDLNNHPNLFICDHHIHYRDQSIYGAERGSYMYPTGDRWMSEVHSLRPDLKNVPIIIYTDDPEEAVYRWTCSMNPVAFKACVAKYNYEGPKGKRLQPWEILLREIFKTPPFIEGNPRKESLI